LQCAAGPQDLRSFPTRRSSDLDFCYGWTVWLFLSWIPTFFVENYHVKLADSALYSAGVLSAGLVGDTVGGLLTDRILRQTGRLRSEEHTSELQSRSDIVCRRLP